MSKTRTANDKKYDLEERTYLFARNVALFCKKLPKNTINFKYIDQVIRASGSVGANYIEANESLSKKDFVMRVKISRKEAKESVYWLRLILDTNSDEFEKEGLPLKTEGEELKKIFSAIITKSSQITGNCIALTLNFYSFEFLTFAFGIYLLFDACYLVLMT